MILIDTSALIASLCGGRQSADNLEKLLVSGEQIAVPSIVLYEWLRGPRAHQELLDLEMFLPRERTISFSVDEAAVAALVQEDEGRARAGDGSRDRGNSTGSQRCALDAQS